jgi:hypothetical protein
MGIGFFHENAAALAFAGRCPEDVLVLDISLGVTGAGRRPAAGLSYLKKD